MKLTIDGQSVTAAEGESVLECALRHEIAIPHLCTHPNLPAFGGCRMCLVRIDGVRGFPASCSTPAADGMVVITNGDELRDLRRSILELIMLEHPCACLVCDKKDLCQEYRPEAEKAGATTGCHTCNNLEVCDVRVLADELGLSDLPAAPSYRGLPIERSDPFMDRDMNLCILCGRCVRVCKHQHGSATIDFINRGGHAIVGTAFGRSLADAGCRFCGSCVDVCPTGALSDRYTKWQGAPDATTETTCVLCDVACALTVFAERGSAVTARAANGETPICVLGRFALAPLVSGRRRLRHPSVKTKGAVQQSDWPRAIADAAESLKGFIGEAFAFVCDTTGTLEDRYVFRRFTELVMKSPNYIELRPDSHGVARAELPVGVRAALVAGDLLVDGRGDELELLIVQDCYPSELSASADIVLPAAVFAEVDGTMADWAGEHRPLHKACEPPGDARPEWRIIADLAAAIGAQGFDYESARAVADKAGLASGELRMSVDNAPPAARDPRLRRTHFRGHEIAEEVPDLAQLPVGTDNQET